MDQAVSVVIVSDYGMGGEEAWNDLRATLYALAHQDSQEPAEFILVECADFEQQIPPDLTNIFPSLKIILSPAISASQLKNEGVQAASADIVAILDADCIPDTAWLRHVVTTFRERPDIVAVSGKTMYAGPSILVRTLGLLERAYLDPGREGNAKSIANNNVAFCRSTLLACPFPDYPGGFEGKVHFEAFRRAGYHCLFEPRMRVIHTFNGWKIEKDMRRHMGHTTITCRRVDPRISFSWMARLGFLSVPLFIVARVIYDWLVCVRLSRLYNVRWYELPFALCSAVVVRFLEVPGMIDAVRGKPVQKTLYR